MSRIAVVLTHFESAAYLSYAVRSILSQTYNDFHLYVLDDCTEGFQWFESLKPMLASGKLSVYRSDKNVGTYRLKNKFIQSIDAEFIAFHDADDFSLPNRLERQLSKMNSKDIGLLGCSFYRSESPSYRTEYVGMPENVNAVLDNGKRLVCLHPTWIMRRSLLNTLGGFDFETRFGADDEFLARAVFCTKVRNLEEALYVKHDHNTSLTGALSTGYKSKVRLDYTCKTDRKIELLKTSKTHELNKHLKIGHDSYGFVIENISNKMDVDEPMVYRKSECSKLTTF